MAQTKLRASTQLENDSRLLEKDGSENLTGDLDAGSNKITNIQSLEVNNNPTQDKEVARKGYVDSVAEGLTVKNAVRVSTPSNYDLTDSNLGTNSNVDPDNSQIDSQWLNRNDRVLLRGQTTSSENGIYFVPDLRSEFELDSGNTGNELRIDLASGNNIHTEVKITNNASSGVDVTTTQGSQTSPHQITVDYEDTVSTVDDIRTAINNDGTASGLVNATTLQSGSVAADNTTNGSFVNMGVFNSGSNANLNRTSDFDSSTDVIHGSFTFVEEGTDNNRGFVMTSDNVTVGTDAISWTQFSGAGQITAGNGLQKSGDTLSTAAADNSITVNNSPGNIQVQSAPSLTVDPGGNTGLGLAPINSGNLYVGQGGSSALTSQSVSGDVSMDNTATMTIQTPGSEIESTGSGIRLKQISAGNILVGQGGSSDVTDQSLSNEGTLDASANFTLNYTTDQFSATSSQTTFSLNQTLASTGKEMVSVNGSVQKRGGSADYTYDSNNNDIVFNSGLSSGDDVLVKYVHT